MTIGQTLEKDCKSYDTIPLKHVPVITITSKRKGPIMYVTRVSIVLCVCMRVYKSRFGCRQSLTHRFGLWIGLWVSFSVGFCVFVLDRG